MVEPAGALAPEQPVSRRLPAKLAAILGEVQRVKQSGYNAFFKYRYATESDVLDVIRPLMGKHGVAFYLTLDSIEVLPHGKDGITRVHVTATFADDGDSIAVSWAGDGQGNDDKALSKALTSAVKSLLIRTFLVSTGEEESAEVKAAPKAEPVQKPTEGAKQPTPIRPATQPPVQTPHEPPVVNIVADFKIPKSLFVRGITNDDRAIYVEAATTLYEATTLDALREAWQSIGESKAGFHKAVYTELGRLGIERRDTLTGGKEPTGTTNGG